MFKMLVQDGLSARLRALPEAFSTPILVKAAKAGAEPIRSRTEALAPRSSPDAGKPGHMADHIVISVVRKVDGRTLEAGEAAVAVGPSKEFFWAGVHEFGPHDGRYAAHPFMRPGFDGGSDEAMGRMLDSLWTSLRAAAAGGAGAAFTPADPSGGGGLL